MVKRSERIKNVINYLIFYFIMQSIQIDGIYTYIENVKTLKIGDKIKLVPNPSNRINSDAIGAYTLNGTKIGYIPFKSNQINVKSLYTVTKINLTQRNPLLLISRNFEHSNVIQIEPEFVRSLKYSNNLIKTNLTNELIKFSKMLSVNGNIINGIGITYLDDNFINILIETPDSSHVFYTVTKKYWDYNVFKFDELFKFNLIPKCVYQPFQTHRLENYIERNYKSCDKMLKSKKIIKHLTPLMTKDNFGFEIIQSTQLQFFNKTQYFNTNLFKLIIQSYFCADSYYNPHNYIKLLNLENTDSIPNIDFKPLTDIYTDIKIGGMCYNHDIKSYCLIDLYDDINYIDIIFDAELNEKKIIESVIKLIISDKLVINLFDPLTGTIYRQELNQLIKNELLDIINK
jgi:hypothetical protein